MKLKYFSNTFIVTLLLLIILIFTMTIFSFKYHINVSKTEYTKIPVLLINTNNNKRIREKKKYIKASIIKDGKTIPCKIRGHGNSTWRLPKAKKPYLLKLEKPESLLDMEGRRKWILLSNLSDQTALRNAYAMHLAKDIFNKQRFVPEFRYVNLFLNGKYEGLYTIFEKIEDSLLNLSGKSFLFEVNREDSRRWSFISKQENSFCLHNNKATEEDFLYAKKIIQDFEDVLYSQFFLDKDKGYKNKIDLDSFVDWYLINEFTKNKDADFSFSCYLYYNSLTDKIGMGPIWDFDLSCGANYENNFTHEDLWVNHKGWFKRLFEDPEFRKAVKTRWNERKKLLENSNKWIDENSRIIKDAVLLDDSVWKTFGHKQWPHIPDWKRRKTYDSHLNYMKDWLSKRFIWMDEELNK